MFIKLTVLLLVSAFLFFLVQMIREHLKSRSSNNNAEVFLEKNQAEEPLKELTFEQLQEKLNKLERKKKLIFHDFVQKNSAQQERVMAETAKVNEKITEIEDLIKENHIITYG